MVVSCVCRRLMIRPMLRVRLWRVISIVLWALTTESFDMLRIVMAWSLVRMQALLEVMMRVLLWTWPLWLLVLIRLVILCYELMLS